MRRILVFLWAALSAFSCFGQASLSVNKSSGLIVAPVTPAQFAAANGLLTTNELGTNSTVSGAQWLQQSSNGPVPVIVEVNFQSDWEDTGIVQTACVLHRQGKINLLGVIVTASTNIILTVPACSSLMDYNQCGQIPIGAWTNNTFGNLNLNVNGTYPGGIYWPNYIATNFPSAVTNVDSAQRLVRRLLASARPNSVVWCHEQPATVLYQILTSGNITDEFSTNSTLSLFNSKVKFVSSLDGDYPYGREYNIYVDPFGASNLQTIVTVPWVHLGFSLGAPTPSQSLPTILWMPLGWTNYTSTNSPCYNLMWYTSTSGDAGRAAFGTSTLLFAAWGNTYQGWTLWTNIVGGGSNSINVNPASPEYGSNYFVNGGGLQNEFYLYGVNTNALSNLVWQVSYPPNGNDRRPNIDVVRLNGGGTLDYDAGFFNVMDLHGSSSVDAIEIERGVAYFYGPLATPPQTEFVGGTLAVGGYGSALQPSVVLTGGTGNATFAGTIVANQVSTTNGYTTGNAILTNDPNFFNVPAFYVTNNGASDAVVFGGLGLSQVEIIYGPEATPSNTVSVYGNVTLTAPQFYGGNVSISLLGITGNATFAGTASANLLKSTNGYNSLATNAYTFTCTSWTNTNTSSVIIDYDRGVTNLVVSNRVPFLIFGPTTNAGCFSRLLHPNDIVTNASAHVVISAF